VPVEAKAQRKLWVAANENVARRVTPPVVPEARDDLSRRVYGILGIPLDVVEVAQLLERIDLAVFDQTPFLLSTPNVNFLMMGRTDREFRESLLLSDLCPADGMPLVWLARLLGAPIRHRLSGTDIFDALRVRESRGDKLKVFLFGGGGEVADSVGRSINSHSTGGLVCVGALNPGFGSVSELSSSATLNEINSANADLLTVFLSARKAQNWLLQNHNRIKAPFRAQFGAAVNVQAGIVKRAPRFLQRTGFEWLWRIKEEPYLWRRYFEDGCGLLYICATQVMPLSIGRIQRSCFSRDQEGLAATSTAVAGENVTIKFVGAATERHIDAATKCFRDALANSNTVAIDVSQLTTIDPRFFGLILMLRKQLVQRGGRLLFSGVTRRARRLFGLNGFGYLLETQS
jgi:N-acetylglucosaminyldiphosphoundecaprenol N-acetyl-beta-D-mannosaminyltransferase